jgi:hypothetical protein
MDQIKELTYHEASRFVKKTYTFDRTFFTSRSHCAAFHVFGILPQPIMFSYLLRGWIDFIKTTHSSERNDNVTQLSRIWIVQQKTGSTCTVRKPNAGGTTRPVVNESSLDHWGGADTD